MWLGTRYKILSPNLLGSVSPLVPGLPNSVNESPRCRIVQDFGSDLGFYNPGLGHRGAPVEGVRKKKKRKGRWSRPLWIPILHLGNRNLERLGVQPQSRGLLVLVRRPGSHRLSQCPQQKGSRLVNPQVGTVPRVLRSPLTTTKRKGLGLETNLNL